MDLRTRSKYTFAALLLGGFLAGWVVLFRQGGGQPGKSPAASSGSGGNLEPVEARASDRGGRAAMGATDSTNLAAEPKHEQTEGPGEARQRGYVERRVAELMELSFRDDPVSIDTILSELTNRDPRIRKAALDATLQARSRDAIPRLMEAAEQTDDPHEKAAIADAIEFLKLPTLGEVMEQMGERGTNAPAEPAGRAD